MANKTQSGQLFSRRSMAGIISIDDGAGTLIEGGVIETNDINTTNLTSDFITANNLLEGDVDETITGKWTFTLPPYLTNYPSVATDAVNKGFADATYATILALGDYLLSSTASSLYQTIAGMALYLTVANASATYQTIADMVNYVGLTGTQTIVGTKTFANVFMTGGYVPSSSLQVATKDYVDNAVVGGGITEGLLFDIQGNSRFQKITGATPPTSLDMGYNNTMIGFESAKQLPNDILTQRNTFLGYRSGYYFAQGYAGASDNTFLGSYAGYTGSGTTPYAFSRTTCVGHQSYGDKSDQVALGNGNCEIRARGSLLVDGYATFNGSGTGLIVNTISSFTQNIYRKIGSISYEVIDQLSASTTYQTLANLATTYTNNNTSYYSTKYIFDNYYPTSNIFATFFQKASIQFNYDTTPTNDECYSTSYLNNTFAGVSTTITQRTPKYFTEWRYSTNNTTGLYSINQWTNGAIAFSDVNPLPANTGNSTFTLGEGVVAGTEYLGQRNSLGAWVATVAGMYKVELVLQVYQSYTMKLWIEYIRGGASYDVDSYLRSNGTVAIAGTSPYGQVCNYSSIQYLDVGHGLRVRSTASGSLTYGYIFTHYKKSYLKITRLSGYT